MRARLLGGAAGIALPAASVALALGIALPSDAQAQTSSFNGTQASTYTLTTPANTPTFTFGPSANITALPGTPGVTGDTLTNWNVINQGQITGGGGGFFGAGIYLNTPGGNSVTNSGSITNGVSLRGIGNSSLANLAGGTITGNAFVYSGTMTNAGTITGNANGGNLTLTNSGSIGGYVSISGTGTVTNQAGGTITGGVVLGTLVNSAPGILTNAGAIGSSAASSNNAVTFNGVGSLTNLSGGTLTGVTEGVLLFFGGTVANQSGATITGGTHGVYARLGPPTTVTNAGAITGTAGNGIYLRVGGSVANQTGGTITGGVNGVYLKQSVYGSSSVANQAGGAIVGGVDGVKIATVGGISTVTNAGSITGTGGTGVSVVEPSLVSVTNRAGGTITGVTGVYANGQNVTVTNAGNITGTGGTAIILNGANPILILQTGSVINGNAVAPDNGTLILQGTGTANNLFTGFLFPFHVQASGVWALNNVNAIGGNTTIESGALVIGDASHPGAQLTTAGVIVLSGGTLGGQGTVDVIGSSGTIFAAGGGTIAPGVASPFSTLNVTGNVQFNTGSFFNVNVNAAGQTDKLALSGTGTLTGGTVQVRAQPGFYAPQTNYTILTDGTRNSTTFAGVTVNSIFLTPTLTYPSQQQVVLTLSASPFSSAAATPNQTATANALNAGPFNALTAAIFGQTAVAGAQQAFNALSGEIFGSVQNTLADETQIIRNAILGRLRQASYADDGGDLVALAYGGPALAFDAPAGNPLALVPAGAYADAQGGSQAEPYVKAPAPPRTMTYWSQALGGFGRVNSDGNAAALTNSFGGVLTGFDARFGAMRAGVMAGYTQSNLNVDARASSAAIDSGSFGAYAGAAFGAFRLRAGGSATFASIDTSRTIAFPGFLDATRAHFGGGTGQAFGEIGYGMAFDRIAVEPFAGLAYVHVATGSFLESGGIAALSGSSDGENIGYASLGLRVASIWMLPGGTALIPRGSIQWQHAFGDVVPTAGLAFAGTGAAFTVSGVPIARDAALVEAGLDWRITPAIKLGVEYQGALAQTAQTHTAKGSFTWDF
jgi:outer membrane autotransporter protein